MNAKINAGIDKLIWQGKKGSEFNFSAGFDGLLKLIESDIDTLKLNASIGSLAIQGISIASNGVVTVASTATLKTGDYVTITGANANTRVGGIGINGQSFRITVVNASTFQLNAKTTGTATATAGTVHMLNAGNVIEVLTAIYNACPDKVKHADDFFLAIPMHIADAYRLNLAANSTGLGAYFTGEKPLNFLGKALIEMPYFNHNTIVAVRKSNLFFGTDLLSDFNSVQVVDMRASTADQKVRYRSNFAVDVNFAFGGEIVVYRP
ncbi:MAG: hypothetical protein DDT42_02134 [candidate division WS2 bacterium]|uniref:Uncharacterized protein n=1 Tax=Psychracetigena formicireducens TaxID=2986056 RepID=A0A9E2BIM5_PSYF1|nr:hypothetical protein [Candidatus Psychracetigena formicireducens]